MFKSKITNFTRNNERRILVDMGVAYDTDLTRAQAIMLETVRALPFTLEAPAPSVWIESLGDSSVTLRVAGWIDQHDTSYLLARSEASRLCLAALDAAGVTMPEPTFRILGPDTPAPVPARAPTKAPDMEAQQTHAHAEAQLEKIVNDERRALGDQDLLNRDAPVE